MQKLTHLARPRRTTQNKVRHVTIFPDGSQSNEGFFISHDVFEGAGPIFLDPGNIVSSLATALGGSVVGCCFAFGCHGL